MSFQFPIELGVNLDTHTPFCLPSDSFNTHYHLIGATGSGKTTALQTMLQGLFTDGNDKRAYFIIDPLGGFAQRLLQFIADPHYCSDSVRERLVYFEPANTKYTTTIQTLNYTSRPNQDYQVARAMDLLLRGFDTQDLMAMPRLRRFLYQAVFDISQLGMPLSIAQYLLHPRTAEHKSLIANLPLDSKAVWLDVMNTHGNKALDYLDSTRNRVSLITDFVLLQRLFSSTKNLLDVPRFMAEGKIVIINLTPGKNEVPWQVADTIGSVIINEVFNQALSQYYGNGEPTDTMLVLDEFQRFLGPDIYNFLPIIRNLGLKLVLANQSFSQLEQGEIDLRPMMGQARSRLMFANDLTDANLLAEEIANLEWNPDEIKYQVESFRQRLVDHEKIILRGGSSTESDTTSKTRQTKRGVGESSTFEPGEYPSIRGNSKQQSYSDVQGGSQARAVGENWREQLVPIYHEFSEISGVQFRGKDDVIAYWRRKLSRSTEGRCYAKLVNQAQHNHVDVHYLPTFSNPRLDEAVAKLIEENYQNGPFITSEQADREFEQVRYRLLTGPKIVIKSDQSQDDSRLDQHGETFDH